jgi:dihydropteroate synthase
MTKKFIILNLTPDSFSDGGKHAKLNLKNFVKNAKNKNAYGIDVGAMSTRPDATLITYKEEIERLRPFIKIISDFCITFDLKLSLDTFNYETANWVLTQCNIDYLNDVSGFKDTNFAKLLKANPKLKYIFMHSLTVPAYSDIVMSEEQDEMIAVIAKYAFTRIDKLVKMGIEESRILFDPGIGFSKNHEQSMYLVKNIDVLQEIVKKNYPEVKMLVGHSRKRFLKHYAGIDPLIKASNNSLDCLTEFVTRVFFDKIDFVRSHD